MFHDKLKIFFKRNSKLMCDTFYKRSIKTLCRCEKIYIGQTRISTILKEHNKI